MLKVEKINNNVSGFEKYPESIRKELIERFGCDGENGNFIINSEYTHELINKIGHFISSQHGKLNVYKLWYCKSINNWRLVFGYK